MSLSSYDETFEVAKETYKKIEGVEEVVDFCTIPLPGISDIDLIVVVKPHANVTIPALKSYSKDQQYIFYHSHFLLSQGTIANLRYFDPCLVRFQPLLGNITYSFDDSELTKHTEEEHQALGVDYALVSWLLPSLKSIAKTQATGELECRYFLESIRIIPYIYRELHRAGFTDQETSANAEMFRELGNRWFEFSEEEQIERCEKVFAALCEDSLKLLKICDEGLQGCELKKLPKPFPPRTNLHKSLLREYPNSIGIRIENEIFIFQKGRSEIKLIYQKFKSPLTKQVYERAIHLLPLNTSATQNRLLFEEGLVPDQFGKCFFTDLNEVPVFTHPALEKRTQVTNQALDETRNTEGGKLMGKTYGFRFKPRRILWDSNLRGRLGGIYDRRMEKVIDTSFGKYLRVR